MSFQLIIEWIPLGFLHNLEKYFDFLWLERRQQTEHIWRSHGGFCSEPTMNNSVSCILGEFALLE